MGWWKRGCAWGVKMVPRLHTHTLYLRHPAAFLLKPHLMPPYWMPITRFLFGFCWRRRGTVCGVFFLFVCFFIFFWIKFNDYAFVCARMRSGIRVYFDDSWLVAYDYWNRRSSAICRLKCTQAKRNIDTQDTHRHTQNHTESHTHYMHSKIQITLWQIERHRGRKTLWRRWK